MPHLLPDISMSQFSCYYCIIFCALWCGFYETMESWWLGFAIALRERISFLCQIQAKRRDFDSRFMGAIALGKLKLMVDEIVIKIIDKISKEKHKILSGVLS